MQGEFCLSRVILNFYHFNLCLEQSIDDDNHLSNPIFLYIHKLTFNTFLDILSTIGQQVPSVIKSYGVQKSSLLISV